MGSGSTNTTSIPRNVVPWQPGMQQWVPPGAQPPGTGRRRMPPGSTTDGKAVPRWGILDDIYPELPPMPDWSTLGNTPVRRRRLSQSGRINLGTPSLAQQAIAPVAEPHALIGGTA